MKVTKKIRPPPGLSALRPDDMLSLRFTWIGLERKGGKLTRVPATRGAVAIIVGFDAQHIAEEAFFETQQGFPLKPPPISPPDSSVQPDPDLNGPPPKSGLPPIGERARARVAGPSRLAFLVPKNIDEIDCTLDALLRACWDFEPSVAAVALPPPARTRAPPQTPLKPPAAPAIKPPAAHHTAIEAPWRLVLSPSRYGAWLHRLVPLPGDPGEPGQAPVELWHTRLAARAKAGPLAPAATIDDGRYRWRLGGALRIAIREHERFQHDDAAPEPAIGRRLVYAETFALPVAP